MHKSSILDIYTCSVRVCDIVREMCVHRASHFALHARQELEPHQCEVTQVRSHSTRVWSVWWFGASATAECLKICGGCDSCRDELACQLLCVVLVLLFVLVCLHEQ